MNHFQLKNELTAIETKIGWTVTGRESSGLLITSILTTSTCISDLWTLDSQGFTDPSEKQTEIEKQESVKKHFLYTIKIEYEK